MRPAVRAGECAEPICALYKFEGRAFSNLYEAALNICDQRTAQPIDGNLAFAEESLDMLDTILVAAGVGFFAVAVLYVLACDHM